VELLNDPADSGGKFYSGAFMVVFCAEIIVGRDVGCLKIWTMSRQAALFKSRLVHVINSKKAKAAF
jgi:hypothetical protein